MEQRLSLPVGIAWGPEVERELEACADPIWLFAPDTYRMLWANPAGLAFWRAESLDALRARDFREGLSAHAAAELEQFRGLLAQGQVASTRWTFFPNRGPATSVDLLMSPVRLPDGRLGMLKRARRDGVTAAAEATRGVEALRHTDVLVTVTSLEGRVLLENPAAHRAYDFSQSTEIDAVSARFAHPEQARRARAQLERGVPFNQEVECSTRAGPRWHSLDIHVSSDPVTNGPCLIITERDISERKAHEAAVEQSRAELERIANQRARELALERDQFEQVFDTVSALVLVVGQDGIIERANAWAHSTLHTSKLVGRDVFEACGFPTSDLLTQWVARGGAPSDATEVVIDTPGDRKLHVLWTPHLSTRLDDSYRLFLTGVDITELRAVETQLQITDRMATIGTLAAGLAHDLNNPLAYITSNAEMLVEDLGRLGMHDDLRAMARDCLEGARQATTIVAQLRTFARGSASGAEGLAHVDSVVRFAGRMAHNHLKHHAQIEVTCPPDLYAVIDEQKLGQVMLNLLVHAADSIEPGEASRHHVRIEAMPDEPGWMRLEVRDDGPGLDPAELRRIFDPYSSAHTPPRGISGLGLAISHRLITEAGGRIEVSSKVSQGTTVQIWLRRVAESHTADLGPTPPHPISVPSAARLEAEDSDKPTILVVDDEPKLRAVMRRALREYQLFEASDGREALALLERRAFDLVICDVMMPEMTGIELFEVLAQTMPEQTRRFVFLSGGAFTPDTIGFLERTRLPKLDKPFRMDALRKLVAKMLERAAREA